jgi:hypothetical protein
MMITKSLSKGNLIYRAQTTTIHISLTLTCLQARCGLDEMWVQPLLRILVVIMLGEKRKRKAKEMVLRKEISFYGMNKKMGEECDSDWKKNYICKIFLKMRKE